MFLYVLIVSYGSYMFHCVLIVSLYSFKWFLCVSYVSFSFDT